MGGCKTEKTTTMVLEVDLQCCSCYKKVKKILCKFPQIGDQLYDEKANTVTITVVCCNPEKIRDKLYSKGCGVIKCIKIKKPKPPPADPPPAKVDPPPGKVDPPTGNVDSPTGKVDPGKVDPPPEKVDLPPQPPPSTPQPVMVVPGYCCCCGQCCGRCPRYHSYGCGRGCHVSRCDWYFIEENTIVCSIM